MALTPAGRELIEQRVQDAQTLIHFRGFGQNAKAVGLVVTIMGLGTRKLLKARRNG